jgi:hypothetical protein
MGKAAIRSLLVSREKRINRASGGVGLDATDESVAVRFGEDVQLATKTPE